MIPAYCVFEYRYRDAANYKQHEDILLCGAFDPSDVEAIELAVNQDMQFIPEQVGLASLQHRFAEFGAVPDGDDHIWHEFVSLRGADATDLARLTPSGSKDALVEAFRRAEAWEEKCSPIYGALRGSVDRKPQVMNAVASWIRKTSKTPTGRIQRLT